jgi:hypothetical protein
MATIEERRKADRKRYRRWREKKLAGGDKQIQLMLAPDAQAVLNAEKARTGEAYVQIIHRAIMSLGKPTAKHGKGKGHRPPDQQKVIERIKALWDGGKGMTVREIAQQLNDEGLPTFSKKGWWNHGTVAKLLREE